MQQWSKVKFLESHEPKYMFKPLFYSNIFATTTNFVVNKIFKIYLQLSAQMEVSRFSTEAHPIVLI